MFSTNFKIAFFKERKAPPKVLINVEEAQVFPGDDFNFTCEAVGYPVPTLKWMKDDESELEGTLIQENKKLHLLLTNIKQSATFKCIGNSPLGSVKKEVKAFVKSMKLLHHYYLINFLHF